MIFLRKNRKSLRAGFSRYLGGILALPLCFGTVPAQEMTSVATLRTEARLVNVYASVRDKKGAIVQNLKKEDFAIEEDRRAQKITFFSRENDLPLTLGLLVDTSPSEARMIDEEREASRSFLEQVMKPQKDQAFLIHFDTGVELLQEITNSLNKLEKALDGLADVEDEPSLSRKQQNNLPASQADPNDSRHGSPAGGVGTTHLFDAIYLASNDVMKSQTGRKALIVIGDGDDLGSTVTRNRAIRAAQQADVIVYCIRIEDKDFGKQSDHKRRFSIPEVGIPGLGIPGLGGPGGGPGGGSGGGPGGGPGDGPGKGGGPDRTEGKTNMEALSSQTGGALFEVSKKLSLGDVFAKIQEELRSLYSLGYTPDANAKPGYRQIKVTVKSKNLKVQAREGYYADRN